MPGVTEFCVIDKGYVEYPITLGRENPNQARFVVGRWDGDAEWYGIPFDTREAAEAAAKALNAIED